MIKSIQKISLGLMALAVGVSLFLSAPALADCSDSGALSTQQAIQCGTNGAAGTNQDSSTAASNVDTTITNLLNLLSTAVGIVSVVMIVVGGFRYITSSGEQEKVKSAKNTILYALIGLVVVALAQIIVKFVLNKATQ